MDNLDYRKNKKNKYNIKDIEKCKEIINNNKITDILYKKIAEGNHGIIYTLKDNCGVVKMYKDKIHINKNYLGNVKKEIQISKLTRYIIENNICPHFVYTYYEVYDEIKSYIMMEHGSKTLQYLLDKNLKIKILKSIFFQILIGILCMHKILGLNHNKLGSTNIIFKKINKNTIFKYIINDKTYYVPIYGILIMIIDFEYMVKIKNYRNYDFNKLQYLYIRPIRKCFREKNINTFKKIIELVTDDNKNNIITHMFNKINKNLVSNKENSIFSSTLNYLVVNNLIDYKSMCDKKVIKLSEKIKKVNTIFFDKKKDIFEIIQDNFKEYETELVYTKEFNMKF